MRYLLFFFLLSTGCTERVASELDQSKTNQILIALSKYGVHATKVKDGTTWSIEVAKQDLTKALEVLAVRRFLAPQVSEEPSTSFVQSKAELQHSLERKLSNSLEETLERMPYILEARVHISAVETLEFSKTIPEKTASVLIVTEPEFRFDLEKIQKLVSGASGLKQESVIVVTVSAQEPTIPLEKPISKTKLNRGFLVLIPILFLSLILARRFDVTSRKNKEVRKILKQEHE